MQTQTYTPQEASAVVGLPLAAVQKAITSKHVPVLRVGKPLRRAIDETSLLALGLVQGLPRGTGLSVAQARALLLTKGITHAQDVKGYLDLDGGLRLDLAEKLGPIVQRIDTFRYAHELVEVDPSQRNGAPTIRGTDLQPETLRDRMRSGASLEAIQDEFPQLDRKAIEATILWADANPRRGRPKQPDPSDAPLVPALRDVSAWTRTMRITARQIDGWAYSEQARSTLPVLARRLVNAAGGSIVKIDFPAGESTNLPDWDAEILSEDATPWVPAGQSFWEVSCEAGVTAKANSNYNRRTKNTLAQIREGSTYVALTARRWPQKRKWLQEKLTLKEWAAVRAYDADDLEQALECNPAVALWLADELGLAGNGVESPTRFWENWSSQSSPPILKEAFFAAREGIRDALISSIQKRLEAETSEPLVVKADSVGEATAFVCAAITEQPDLASSTLVVTEPSGWRYVEQNPLLKVAVASRTEIAESPTMRKGMVTIIPFATGDFPSQYRGAAALENDNAVEFYRPQAHEFEEALVRTGVDRSDAKRLAVTAGRSWSVFRRHRAENPALRHPSWLDCQQSRALSTLCLLGSWSGANKKDREIVAQVAGRTYEDVEKDLRHLATMDDTPVLAIGDAWKAKSSLELIDTYGDRIVSDELDRFLEIARNLLTAEDPQLELEEEKRFAAAVYGKVRPESGLLHDAVCDTLVKFAVRGPELASLASLHIANRIGTFVAELLRDASPTRWLSLASYLPQLAEAAPSEFLAAVATSLRRPDAPVTRLISETSSAGFGGRCWHAGLLWALECLAWAPNQLAKVCLILAQLSKTPVKGNWANSPIRSLHGIFRTWLPQTAATVEQRNEILDRLISAEPDVAFQLLEAMTNVGHDVASPAFRPRWRDDDAGAGHGAKPRDHYAALVAIADRFLRYVNNDAARVARAVDRIDQLYQIDGIDSPNPSRVAKLLNAAETFTREEATDEERELIRTELRQRLYWHLNYGEKDGELLPFVANMENLYERLAPHNPVIRNKWLFAKNWINIPVREKDFRARAATVEELRKKALAEIINASGFAGVTKLSTACPGSVEIGRSLAELNLDTADLAHWIVDQSSDLTPNDPVRAALLGLLRSTPAPSATQLLMEILDLGRQKDWAREKIANCLASAPDERETWSVVASLGSEIEEAYWQTSNPDYWLRDSTSDFEFVLRKLVAAKRPRTALNVCHMDFEKVDPELLAQMFEGMLRGEEPNGNLLSPWDVANAVKRLEVTGAIPDERLIRLEFGLIPALGFDGEHKATFLYRALMTRPELFVECLRLVYKAENDASAREINDSEKTAANIAWQVLHHCKRLPGLVLDTETQRPVNAGVPEGLIPEDPDEVPPPSGTINAVEFKKFVEDVRTFSQAEGRLKVCDIMLGQIMSYAPAEADGTWPCVPVRDLLDRPELEAMRDGFRTGLFNKRGVHSKSPIMGGVQERQIALTYHRYAKTLETSHPFLSSTLTELAEWYEGDGIREDSAARLRLEAS